MKMTLPIAAGSRRRRRARGAVAGSGPRRRLVGDESAGGADRPDRNGKRQGRP